MDISNWKAIIAAAGGYENIAAMVFDNGSKFSRDGSKRFEDEVTLDETNGAWKFRKSGNTNGIVLNNKKVNSTWVRDNAQLIAILFVDTPDDLPKIDRTW